MNKRILLILVLALALVLSACGGGDAADDEPAASEGPFKVAIIMPSSITDLAFSQSMFDALLAVQEEMGDRRHNHGLDVGDRWHVAGTFHDRGSNPDEIGKPRLQRRLLPPDVGGVVNHRRQLL